MNNVQFDPKIATDLQIDWRRHASAQNSDLFAELLSDRLKRPIDADRPDRHAWRSHAAPDTLSGRPPRLVIAHARTIRGEAKEVEDPAERLPDHTDCAQDKSRAEGGEESTEPVDAESVAPPAEAEADTGAGVPDNQTAEPAEQSEADPTAMIVVAVQPAAQKATDSTLELEALLTEAAPAEGKGVAPEQPETMPADGSEVSTEANTEGAAEQQAAAALAEAGLSDFAATLIDGEDAAAGEPKPDLAFSPEPATPLATDAGEQPLIQIPEAPAPVPEIVPAQPQPARPAMDIKLRPSAAARAHAPADPAPSSSATPQSAQPHLAALPQQAVAGESGGDTFDQPLSADGSGAGWAFHLAQGAAGKRADFVAQLRQHLQNLPAHEQVAVHIQRAMREGTGKFSIQLSPAELGNIHVKLEFDEEKRVTATVTVERPSTLELLQRDIKGLERALHNAGLNMEGGDLSFSLGRGSDQEFAQDMNRSAASAAGGAVPDGASEADQSDILAAQVLDTAAGVVNLQV